MRHSRDRRAAARRGALLRPAVGSKTLPGTLPSCTHARVRRHAGASGVRRGHRPLRYRSHARGSPRRARQGRCRRLPCERRAGARLGAHGQSGGWELSRRLTVCDRDVAACGCAHRDAGRTLGPPSPPARPQPRRTGRRRNRPGRTEPAPATTALSCSRRRARPRERPERFRCAGSTRQNPRAVRARACRCHLRPRWRAPAPRSRIRPLRRG